MRLFLVKGSRREAALSTSPARGFQLRVAFESCFARSRSFPFLAILLIISRITVAQAAKPVAAPAAMPPATIKSFRLVMEKDGPAVEILSTRPVVPAIQLIENPSRLVIDLPNAVLEGRARRFKVETNQISALRGDQFQASPAVARIVVDLMAPRNYTWDAAGNRLVVHLGPNPSTATQTPFQTPTVPSLTPSPQPVVASVRASSPLAIAQSSLSTGASVTASGETAVLALSRGGEVYVCPGTSVSVTPSQNGHNVMLGMNHGGLETHFTLDASSDSIMTPDFRILLPGPGEFHYAISADSRGNTCVRALPGNTAAAIVSELIGDRTYQVKAADQLLFHSGQLDQVDTSVRQKCGCPPPPRQATQQALNETETTPATTADPASNAASTATQSAPTQAQGMPAGTDANGEHVQVTAPLVFRATGPPPPPAQDAQGLPPDSRQLDAPAVSAPVPPDLQPGSAPTQNPPPKPAPQPKRSFLRRFFGAIFR